MYGLSAHQPTKDQRKPMKVVFIPNPKVIEASASDFKAIVQQLTGNGSRAERASLGMATVTSRASAAHASTAEIAREDIDEDVLAILSSFNFTGDDNLKEMVGNFDGQGSPYGLVL